MHTIKQILNRRQSSEIWSIAPDATVYEAIQMLADKRIGALVVLRGPDLLGIISERDYAREVILKGRASKDTRVEEIMSTEVITAPSSETVDNSMALMSDKNIRHLPIVDDGRLVGMVSLGDLVKDIINDQQSTIEQLENYIRG